MQSICTDNPHSDNFEWTVCILHCSKGEANILYVGLRITEVLTAWKYYIYALFYTVCIVYVLARQGLRFCSIITLNINIIYLRPNNTAALSRKSMLYMHIHVHCHIFNTDPGAD